VAALGGDGEVALRGGRRREQPLDVLEAHASDVAHTARFGKLGAHRGLRYDRCAVKGRPAVALGLGLAAALGARPPGGTSAPAGADPGRRPEAAATRGAGNGGGTLDELRFAVIGDTRPANLDDTANYPGDVVRQIWTAVEAEAPHPPFAVTTGDYMFA